MTLLSKITSLFSTEGQFKQVPTRHGFPLWIPVRDQFIGPRLEQLGTWEPVETAAVKTLLTPGAVALDIGANLGYFSVLMSRLVGMNGRVMSFEPERHMFELLSRNTAENGCTNVECHRVALSDSNGEAFFVSEQVNKGDHHLQTETERDRGKKHAERVRIATLDEMAGALPRVDFIKLDVQGCERKCLVGAGNVMRRNEALLILFELSPSEMARYQEQPRQLIDLLSDQGFSFIEVTRVGTDRRPESQQKMKPVRDWSEILNDLDGTRFYYSNVLAFRPSAHDQSELVGRLSGVNWD